MHYCLNQPSVLTRILSFCDLHIFGMKNLDSNFLLCVKEDDYEVCQVGDLRLLRGLRDRQGAGGGEGDEEGGQRYQSEGARFEKDNVHFGARFLLNFCVSRHIKKLL